jgi:hypothetical protein
MTLRYIAVLAASLALFGCVAVKQSAVFNAADFASYDLPGTAVIHGHAFARTDDGLKHNAAGLKVYLMPLTPYTEERAAIMRSGREPEAAEPGLNQHIKVVIADVSGGFEFAGLPPGGYVVYSKIEWSRKHSSGDYYVVGQTSVANGEKKHLVVTNNDQ